MDARVTLRAPGRSTGWAVFWFALLGAGQLATLSMIDAGPRVGYQHYTVPWRLLADVPRPALVVFAAEILAVLWGLARTDVVLRLRALLPGWRLWAVSIVFAATSATGTQYLPAYAAELVLATLIQLVHLGAVILFAIALPLPTSERLARMIAGGAPADDEGAGHPSRIERRVWPLALAVVLVAVVLGMIAYERHPHVPDEVVYLLQARYLAEGLLTLPLPPAREAFNVDLMMYQSDRWFSPVPPGWPFLLAAATAVGATWLLNPVLGGLNILLAAVLLRAVYPRRVAHLAVVLLAASPWHLFMSMNVMTHTATLTAALAAAVATARLRKSGGLHWAVLGGLGIAIVGLIRPLEAIPVAILLGLWSLGAPGGKVRLLPSAVLTVSTMVFSAAVLPYNRYLTGSSTTFPIMAYTDATYGPGTNALGFGPDRGLPFSGLDPLPGHGAADVLINANFNAFQTNIELFGWACGSLLALLLLLTATRLLPADRFMLAMMASVIGIHSFYYFSGGPDFGARYWYLIIIPCVALAARGLIELERRIAERAGIPTGSRVMAGTVALIGVAMLVFVPWRAVDKYHHYRGMQPHASSLAAIGSPVQRGIVLIRGRRHPDFASAFMHNPLDLSDTSATIFAWDRDLAARRALVAAYPDRTFWIVEGPTVTGRSYEIMAGPIRGDELLARTDSVIPWP